MNKWVNGKKRRLSLIVREDVGHFTTSTLMVQSPTDPKTRGWGSDEEYDAGIDSDYFPPIIYHCWKVLFAIESLA